MLVFVISNTVAATAPNFETLLASRLFSAVMHAPFFGLCMSLAVHISPPNRRTGAIAAVQGGLTVAVMLGVPFGSYLGGLFDWRSEEHTSELQSRFDLLCRLLLVNKLFTFIFFVSVRRCLR